LCGFRAYTRSAQIVDGKVEPEDIDMGLAEDPEIPGFNMLDDERPYILFI
jgi:hypothetical protein